MLDNLSHIKMVELCDKYSAPLPRYTSYPTALELKPLQDSQDKAIIYDVIRDSASDLLYLYTHLPYCPNLCLFCACNKIHSTDAQDNQRYLQLLAQECGLIKKICGRRPQISMLHLGGGSPSYLSTCELEELYMILSNSFEIIPGASLSMEVDPRTFNAEKAACAVKLGFKRMSVGIQDFDANVQEITNRRQSARLSEACLNYLRKCGCRNINLDLIYGLPEQHLRQFQKTAERAAALRPERISLFGYAHVSWKAPFQSQLSKYRLPPPHERIAMFLTAWRIFCEAGYNYLGLDHFALPDDELCLAKERGDLRRNFMGYTPGGYKGTLAIGCSSISDLRGCLYQNHSRIEPYRESLLKDTLPTAKMLVRSKEDLLRAYMIERLMCDSSLELNKLTVHAGANSRAEEIFKEGLNALTPLEADGLVETTQDSIVTTPLGRLFVRNIASVFDAYLSRHQRQDEARFSQGV